MMLERQMFMQHFEDYPWKITEIMQMPEMGAGHESLTPCLCFCVSAAWAGRLCSVVYLS